jgi:hypothetical protein
MNNLTTIASIVRNLINDEEKSGTDVFVYTSSSLFTLTEKNVTAISTVLVNDIETGVTYTEDLTNCRVNVTSSLSTEDIVQVDYTYYSNYSLNELYSYIKSALVHLSTNGINTYKISGTTLYPEPCDAEANLIALIASVIINPQNVSYRMPDISVAVPKDLSTLDKIRKILSIYKKVGNSEHGAGLFFIAENYDTDWQAKIII